MRAEEGMTLIELLIAMVVMSIGIAALVAGFSSSILSVNRAHLASTTAALADEQMELHRQAASTSLIPAALSGDGADRLGRSQVLGRHDHQLDVRRRPAEHAEPYGADVPGPAEEPCGQARHGRGSQGLDAIRRARFQRERDLRLIDVTTHST